MTRRLISGASPGWIGAVTSAAFYALVIAALFWRCLFLGEAFVPARQLDYVSPWSASAQTDARPAWNPLHYDSVAEYWVYRDYATRRLRSGRLPLWNPHQFCGAPFAANNVSAIYYPGNLVHLALGAARGAGWSAALHLLLAAMLMRAFMRGLGRSAPAATLAGALFALASWQVSWLHLPPFLSTSCWLPAVLLAILRLREGVSPGRVAALGLAVALTLLAGHLQIAFYVLGAALLWALWATMAQPRQSVSIARLVAAVLAGFCLGMAVATPQLLPSAELARYAHRAGGPTSAGYSAYVAYAAHPAAIATLLLPDYFGTPARSDMPYIGFSRGGMYYNYAEGAMYVGVLPLLLAAIGAAALRGSAGHSRFAASLAILSLLIAIGTPLTGLLYFGVPGFSRTGSPGRILALWTFAACWLAAAGYDALTSGRTQARTRSGALAGTLAIGALFVAAASAAARSTLGAVPSVSSEALTQLGFLAAAVAACLWLLPNPKHRGVSSIAVAAIACSDLLFHGVLYNGTAHVKRLGQADLISFVRRASGHDRIAPVNRNWSFAGPQAVMPPNLATAFGLRDVQGYDSLFPGQYKNWLRSLAGSDPSPREVGNMVFVPAADPRLLDAAGVRVVLSATPITVSHSRATFLDGAWVYERLNAIGRARATTEAGAPAHVSWLQDSPGLVTLAAEMPEAGVLELRDQFWPGWSATVSGAPAPIERADGVFRRVRVPGGRQIVEFRYVPATTLIGLYFMCLGVCAIAACAAGGLRRLRTVTEV